MPNLCLLKKSLAEAFSNNFLKLINNSSSLDHINHNCDGVCITDLKVRIHGAMAELHRVSTPKFVARKIARNIAAVESRPTSATLRTTNFFVYPPSAVFRAIV